MVKIVKNREVDLARRCRIELETHEIKLVLPEYDNPESQQLILRSLQGHQELGHATKRNPDLAVTVAERLRALMHFFGDTDRQAAIRIGTHPSEVSNILNERKDPTEYTVTKLAKAYELPRSFFLGDLSARYDPNALNSKVGAIARSIMEETNLPLFHLSVRSGLEPDDIQRILAEKFIRVSEIRALALGLGVSFRQIFSDPLRTYPI